jgi:hypothetical protein
MKTMNMDFMPTTYELRSGFRAYIIPFILQDSVS